MVGRTADVSHSLRGKPFREIAGDVAGSIVAEQAGFMGYPRLVAAFGNALAPVQLRDAVLTTKAVQHGTDLFLRADQRLLNSGNE